MANSDMDKFMEKHGVFLTKLGKKVLMHVMIGVSKILLNLGY